MEVWLELLYVILSIFGVGIFIVICLLGMITWQEFINERDK